MADFTYDVKKVIGVISEGNTSRKELRLISWNGREPKYDIRDWWTDKEGNERMGKGITLTKDELGALVDLFDEGDCDE